MSDAWRWISTVTGVTERIPVLNQIGLCVVFLVAGMMVPNVDARDGLTVDELAAKIDQQIEISLERQTVKPVPTAEDLEFLRRVTLDLTGRIPTVNEIHRFVADKRTDKRSRLVDQLLERPRHAAHLAHVWRDWLVPELAAVPEGRYFQPGFEAWLSQRFRERMGYDQIVRELLSVPLPGSREQAEHVFRDLDRPNPLAFFAVKDAQPDKLAATATRAFLSIQLECAQCHSHPFAEWKQEQFWNQAAFFAGIKREGNGLFAPLIEDQERRSISPGDGKPEVVQAFLFGNGEAVDGSVRSRVAFAKWVTDRDNDYFARSATNRIWALLFGVGLVQPIDDFHEMNPSSHPQILDELSKAFVSSGYNFDVVFRAICATRAYQRTSACTSDDVADPRLYSRMLTKGLSADQAWDSLSLAVGWTNTGERLEGATSARKVGRNQFQELFTPRSWPAEPETSASQALALMNGELLGMATTLDHSPALIAATETPGWTDDERLTVLYLSTLSRPPSELELGRLRSYLAVGGADRRTQSFEDIFWMLLNSGEFRLNH